MGITPHEYIPALCIWREAKDEPSAYNAIYWVIKNRAADKAERWPRTLTEVCLQRWQFHSFDFKGDIRFMFPTPADPEGWKAFEAVTAVVEANESDPTNGATHFHDTSVEPPAAQWLGPGNSKETLKQFETLAVGSFRFYNIPPKEERHAAYRN